jgi:hypothetical protein
VVKKIYAMNPETRSAYLDAMATGEVYDVTYGRYTWRKARAVILGVAPSLSNAVADQLVLQAPFDRQLFVISTAEVVSVSVVPPTGKVE